MEKNKEIELISGLKSLSSYDPEYRKRYSKKRKEEEPETETEQEFETEIKDELDTKIEIETDEEIDVETETSETPFTDDTMVLVKIDGKEQQIPLKELKNGYMMHSDYTKKTQELAGLKDTYVKSLKTAELSMKAFNNELQNPRHRHEEARLKQILDNVNWDKVSAEEMGEVIKIKLDYERVKNENDKYYKNMEKMREIMKQESEAHKEQMRIEEKQKLEQLLPDFADETKRKEIREKMTSYLKNRLGEDKVEAVLSNLVNHLDFMILHDAMIGNDYQTNKLPKKSVIKQKNRLSNDGIKESSAGISKKSLADKTLRQVKSRGERAPATKEELMTILASKFI